MQFSRNSHTVPMVAQPTMHTRTVMYTQQRTHVLLCTPNDAHTYCYVHLTTHTRTVMYTQRRTHVLSCTPNNAHTYCHVHPTTHTRTVMYTQQRTHVLSCTPNNTHTYCHVHPTTHTRTVMYTQQRTHVLSSTPNDAHTNGHVQVLINKHEVHMSANLHSLTYIRTYIYMLNGLMYCMHCMYNIRTGFYLGGCGHLTHGSHKQTPATYCSSFLTNRPYVLVWL